ncbi:hypothetical protein B0H10DRAFT_1673423, partial [Mycena sp. CBHHK59/15]
DLPAARKVAGVAGVSSHFYCTVCKCFGLQTLYRSDFEHSDWEPRDVAQLHQNAEAWRNTETQAERDEIFNHYGVRWSEFWRLPYWNPTRMLVIDAMHCVLEGLVHYHCRRVLRLDAEVAKKSEEKVAAFSHEWHAYNLETTPNQYHIKNAKEEHQITLIHRTLVSLIVLLFTTEPGLTEQEPLMLPDHQYVPKAINLSSIKYVQHVIVETTTPSWINSVPENYGESNAGTIKADEWRILATVYIPITLVLMWGDQPGENAAHLLGLLDHSMALFQAVTLACRYTMTRQRAIAYCTSIKEWVNGLYIHHPHTVDHTERRNIHAAFHIYDFLLLFGPVISWWCFPFECLIGILQK